MNANELRIGNWIHNESFGLHGSPKNIQIDGNFFNGLKLNDEVYKSANPIPLTEEWLIKFGFEKNDMFNSFTFRINERLGFYKRTDGLNVHTDDDILSIKSPESVHQLQNLYFALTGEELTIKE